ncbi:MAG: hypothetical protein JO307_20695 [Bryobacterales bacterium]|nr:hypothetical protein [Bryobacterales bacterium]MBV9398816.1 hypothetical protein [Bryobacterales bacterium]
MLSFKRFAPLALVAAVAPSITLGQPALTTIQDILYRADGTRFDGTLFIAWNSFQAGNGSNIATANLTLPVVNGALKVQLVPTTTASAGAQYNITYSNNGVNEFTEIWSVPPSSLPLRVKDVRVSTGTVVGPQPVTSAIQISDVIGLQNELSIRAMEGAGYAIGRTAVINDAGQIDAAVGNLSDCVRVDGSSGPCGSGGGLIPSYSDAEIPSGTVNGVNTTFTLMYAPSPAASLELFLNGLLMEAGSDYQLSGNTIMFFVGSLPQPGDLVLASYRYANPANPLGSLTGAQVVCSTTGSSTASTSLTSLGTCTLPAGLLGVGDRLELQFQYAHNGIANGFTGEIHVGGTTVFSRSATSSETALVGKIGFALNSTAQQWDLQSWGGSLAFQTGAGVASENTTQALTLNLLGKLAATGTDTVVLNNFTVVRYPAQVNP